MSGEVRELLIKLKSPILALSIKDFFEVIKLTPVPQSIPYPGLDHRGSGPLLVRNPHYNKLYTGNTRCNNEANLKLFNFEFIKSSVMANQGWDTNYNS